MNSPRRWTPDGSPRTGCWTSLLFLTLALCAATSANGRPAPAPEIEVDAMVPAGNIIVVQRETNRFLLRTDLRDTAGWWFYWHFQARHAAGKTVRFEFVEGEPVGVRGPAVSTDAGHTWHWLGAQAGNSRGFTYAFATNQESARFAFTIPYLQAHWEAFLTRCADTPMRRDQLTHSKKGRPVELLYAGAQGNESAHRILLTARHHACESMASFVLEGLMEEVLTGRSEAALWLRRNAQFLVVPFVDKDGVEDGDQGKNRRPRDHNRDYDGGSVHPEISAIRSLVPRWSKRQLAVAIDLHCPHIRGPRNECIYIVGSGEPNIWGAQQKFGAVLEKVRNGPLPFQSADILPHGKEWNVTANYADGKSSMRWAEELPGTRLTISLEIPYANARGEEVNPESARTFGRDLAQALWVYLIKPTEHH